MSFKVLVLCYGETEWVCNALRFATREEALDYGVDLAGRWTAVRGHRPEECDDPVNYTFKDGKLEGVHDV